MQASFHRLDETSHVARSTDILEAEVDGGVVLMSNERGVYYEVAFVAEQIWRLLDEPRTCRQICQTLVTRYDVGPEQCRREVMAFLRGMLEEGALELVD